MTVLQISLQMIADELEEEAVSFLLLGDDVRTPQFNGIQFFCGQKTEHDQLYIINADYTDQFPINEYSFISTQRIFGNASCINDVHCSDMELLNHLLRIFEKYHRFENDLNNVITGGGNLEELCRIGSAFFRNPIYIHDAYFNVIALPAWIQGMINFSYNEETKTYNIPLNMIEDFKFNDAYRKTMTMHHAGIWGNDQYPYEMRSLYANLWDENDYRGRILVNELNTPLRESQHYLIEFLAEKAVELLRQGSRNARSSIKDYEKTMRSLLLDNRAHPRDMNTLMTTLEWKEKDTYLCTCLESQDTDIIITSENVFRSALASIFPNSILFFEERRLFMIQNLTKYKGSAADVRHSIAPLARDSLMYGGMSAPTAGIYNLPYAYRQAGIALDYASTWKNAQWVVPFENCALAYLRDHIEVNLPPEYLAAHALQELKKHDEAKGSDFYHTLRTYLECERNIPKTSAALIIHRTTLLYRLEKIEELIHLHLEDPDERLYLLISFRLLEGEA